MVKHSRALLPVLHSHLIGWEYHGGGRDRLLETTFSYERIEGKDYQTIWMARRASLTLLGRSDRLVGGIRNHGASVTDQRMARHHVRSCDQA